jgi:hypothetical protein
VLSAISLAEDSQYFLEARLDSVDLYHFEVYIGMRKQLMEVVVLSLGSTVHDEGFQSKP